MTATTTLTMVDGVRVVVPDSLDLITTYVLREQQDWFEDEIKFLRRLLEPGQRIIDIGANYGVYTLAMAALVGPKGHVWAFEPATSTAAILGQSVAANGFAQVTVVQNAVSGSPGTARLSLNDNAELNALQRGDSANETGAAGAAETVRVVSLDSAREDLGLRGIDFMKIDAEGEELNILRGGSAFFAKESPLIQYEIKVDAGPNLELVRTFAELGYPSYRLVPGLNCLVPFEINAPIDNYQLNLFCCKPERAEQLEAGGFLIRRPLDTAPLKSRRREGFFSRLTGGDSHGWRRRLATLPYGAMLAASWEKTVAAGRSAKLEDALSLYAFSRDAGKPMDERYAALEASLEILVVLYESEPHSLRHASLARAALDYGARALGVSCLHRLSVEILEQKKLDPTEPFLAPSQRFETIAPGQGKGTDRAAEAIGPWICTAVLEELERNMSFSSYYTGANSLQSLRNIRELGYASGEMLRRLELVELRFGL